MKKIYVILSIIVSVFILDGCSTTDEVDTELDQMEIEIPLLGGNEDLLIQIGLLTDLYERNDIQLPYWEFEEYRVNYVNPPILESDKEVFVEVILDDSVYEDRIDELLETLLEKGVVTELNLNDSTCKICIERSKEFPYLVGNAEYLVKIQSLQNILDNENIEHTTYYTELNRPADEVPTDEYDENGCPICSDSIIGVPVELTDDNLRIIIEELEGLLTTNGITIPD